MSTSNANLSLEAISDSINNIVSKTNYIDSQAALLSLVRNALSMMDRDELKDNKIGLSLPVAMGGFLKGYVIDNVYDLLVMTITWNYLLEAHCKKGLLQSGGKSQ